MKKAASWFFFILLVCSCKKDPTDLSTLDDFNLQGHGRIKTLYIFSSSSETEPYATNAYTYDEKGNVKKILISDYPAPMFASYTYEYSDEDVLLVKKYNAIEGANRVDQTESDFILITEYKYSYMDDKKTELVYQRNELRDSVIYAYINGLLVSENHYNLKNGNEWSIKYQYDSFNRLIRKTENPDGIYTLFFYEGSRLSRSECYDNNSVLTVDNELVYSKSEDKVIVESIYKSQDGDFLSAKMTYKDGNLIEHIQFHPTFQGEEWYCHRYEYY